MTMETRDSRAQACHILKSYLRSAQIPYTNNGKGLVVGANAVELDDAAVKALTSPDLTKVLSVFHAITDAAGYGKPNPVDRGEAPNSRADRHQAFELVYLRHSALRRSPNPSPEALEELRPIAEKAAAKAMFRFNRLFLKSGYDVDDLTSIAMTHAITFLHAYGFLRIPSDNHRLFMDFVNQRFAELGTLCSEILANPDNCEVDEIHNNDIGDFVRGSLGHDGRLTDGDTNIDLSYEEGEFTLTSKSGAQFLMEARDDGNLGLNIYLNGRLLTRTEVEELRNKLASGEFSFCSDLLPERQPSSGVMHGRQAKAREELCTKLSEMEPSRREIVLSYAALARFYNPDARDVARALCEELVCPKCSKKVFGGPRCATCDIEGTPRFGIDYVAVREQLRRERDSISDGMTAGLSDAQQRTERKKAQAKESAKDAGPTPTRELVDAMEAKMKEDLFAKLPAELTCCNCRLSKPKAEFGVRIPKRNSDGTPIRAAKMSRCKDCHNAPSKSA